MSADVDFEPIFRVDGAHHHPVGMAFSVDGAYQWAPLHDPVELIRVGDWLAANEESLQHYTTTRHYGGFVVIFKTGKDLWRLWEWFVAGHATPKPDWPQYDWLHAEGRCRTPEIDEQKAFIRRNRRRTKYNQLPGSGDRAWSAPFNRNVIAKLRFRLKSPFWKFDNSNIYVPVSQMRSMVLSR